MVEGTVKEDVVVGYKATDKNMQCREFQFELGVWHKHDGEIAMYESGFHFCEYPSGPWSFYSAEGARFFEVEAKGVLKGDGPGADLKHVAMEIRLVKEITPTGDWNTGDWNTGHSNTGDWNTGDGNTGHRNTGDWNTGHRNTGDWNTGHSNTGDGNTGHGNTGYRNTGYRNTGDRNTGDRHSGDLCHGEAPYYIFNKLASRYHVDDHLVWKLSALLLKDDEIDPSPFLTLPNASAEAIKDLHDAHKTARNRIKG